MVASVDRPARQPEKTGSQARSSARLAAVQGLYQMDIAGTSLDAVIDERIGYVFTNGAGEGAGAAEPAAAEIEPASPPAVSPDPVFLAELLRGVMRRQLEIDPAVDQQLAEGWRLVRIDSTMRAIMRAGTFELIERSDVPARVVISEYVQIAHAFFAGEEPKVVNGVLDKLARRYRPAEFEPRLG